MTSVLEMLEVRSISYADVLAATALLAEYSAECSIPEIGRTNPQAELYAKMEATGLMKTFGAYSGDSLIGFASILIYVLPHYGQQVASVESLFVSASYRDTGAGLKLINTIEDHARKADCVVMLYSAPTGGSLEQVLSARKGCRRTNSVFTKIL